MSVIYRKKMDLFQKVDFKSSAGLDLTWKIECDAISNDEWECIAHMIVERANPFRSAIGVPRGGVKLAEILNEYGTGSYLDPVCIVDDVLTTGKSMEECKIKAIKDEEERISICKTFAGVTRSKAEQDIIVNGSKVDPVGWVVFARYQPAEWITSLFYMAPNYRQPKVPAIDGIHGVLPKEKLDINY